MSANAYSPDTTSALARRQTLAELAAVYEKAQADIRRAFELLAGAEDSLTEAFGNGHGHLRVKGRYRDTPDFRQPEESLGFIRREVWKQLVDRMGVRSFMSVAAAKQLNEQLEKGDLPEVSPEAIVAMLRGFEAQADDMLASAVDEVFEFLRPRSMRAKAYKRNSQFEVPARVALPGVVEPGYGGLLRVRYHYEQDLTALENVLHSLAGKGSVQKTFRSDLANSIAVASEGETDLFRYRAFKNGSLHLQFRDLELLARFNARAGGKRLHAAAE